LLFQQAANQPDATAPARAAHARMTAGREARPWLRNVNKPQSRSARLMTLAGHTDWSCPVKWWKLDRILPEFVTLVGGDADGAEDVKSDVLKLLGKPESRFSTATGPVQTVVTQSPSRAPGRSRR
jgi:hypothetical protein